MKRYLIMVLIIFSSSLAYGAPRTPDYIETLTDSVFVDALNTTPKVHIGKFFYYKVQIILSIIPGDLTEEKFKEPVEFYAGASYGSALKPGSTYGLFITKSFKHDFSWAHRDDVAKIDVNDKRKWEELVQKAERVYKKTSIYSFRRADFNGKPSLPKLPEEILNSCKQFRANPENRVEWAIKIYESKLGSRHSNNWRFDSSGSPYKRFIQPEILLSREQLLFLLGEPSIKTGYIYHWCCGTLEEKVPPTNKTFITIIFDRNEMGIRVLYYSGINYRYFG